MEKTELMTIKEAADFLKVNIMTVRRLIKSGKLKAINISAFDTRSNWRIKKESLLRLNS